MYEPSTLSKPIPRGKIRLLLQIASSALLPLIFIAQTVPSIAQSKSAPVTDSAAQASPLMPAAAATATDTATEASPMADELEKKTRSDLVVMALGLKLTIGQRDSKEAIIDAIVAAQNAV